MPTIRQNQPSLGLLRPLPIRVNQSKTRRVQDQSRLKAEASQSQSQHRGGRQTRGKTGGSGN